MIILITGGSKCGKSRIAEKILSSSPLPRYYIATMQPFGNDAEAIIARHRAAREGKGFVTVERYTDIGQLSLPQKGAALLECMGNLCANEMFSSCAENPFEKIVSGIFALSQQTDPLIIVTNQIDEDGMTYSDTTMAYFHELGRINCAMAQAADCVIEAVCGIPLVLKGEKPECLS